MVDEATKSTEYWIYVILPIILLIASFALRATILPAYWYFIANLSLLAINVIFIRRFIKVHNGSKNLYHLLWFQIPITAINFIEILSYREWNISWAISAHKMFEDDLLTRGSLGILNGAAGMFIFFLNSRNRIKENDEKIREQILHNYRSVVGLTAFISFVISAGSFIIQEPLIVAWTLRTALLLSGFVTSSFAMSLGILFGYTRNTPLLIIGSILSFVLTFFLGLAMIPFSSASSDLVFVSQLVFYTNSVLITGLVAYMANHENHIYNVLVGRIIGSKHNGS